MKNKWIGLGILVLTLVLGMLILGGCASLAEMLNPPPPPTDDGIGGNIVIRVESRDSSGYWWVGHTGDDDGAGFYINRNQPVSVSHLNNAIPYQRAFKDDVKYTIYYRPLRQGDNITGAQGAAGNEDKRLWSRRTVYISKDETVTITLP